MKFLDAKNRARSIPASAPEIYECVHVRQFASHDEKLLGILKGALLLIEAALPLGSIGPSEYGTWNSHTAALWRNLVKNSPGAGSLMKCVLLLEDAISPDWLHPKASYLFSAVTRQWRALSEASLPAIALRVSLLDNGLKYSFVGKSRHR